MKWSLIITAGLLFSVPGKMAFGKSARTLSLTDSDVGQIQTALGYSTILHFESKPTSAVLGDQDAFKVEYVGNSLTLKPLLPNAKTNLFVFNDYERFNFRLVTGAPTAVDYVIKVKRKNSVIGAADFPEPIASVANSEPAPEKMTFIPIGEKASCGPLSLVIELECDRLTGDALT